MKKTLSTVNISAAPGKGVNPLPPEGPIEIDLSEIIRSRVGGIKGKLIPGFLLSSLERLICQEQLNELLHESYPLTGEAFARRILDLLDIKVEVEGLHDLPEGESFVFASNHPLGGLDGITLVAVLGKRYGDEDLRVVVNDMLMNVAPLVEVFLPVNKYGSQGRESARLLNEAFRTGKQLVFFPAGLVSRLQSDGSIRDLSWKKAVVTKSVEFGRRIVPIRFEALNSMRFYKTARRRGRVGLKINIEQALLPSEVFRSRGKTFRLIFGTPLNPADYSTPQAVISALRAHTDSHKA